MFLNAFLKRRSRLRAQSICLNLPHAQVQLHTIELPDDLPHADIQLAMAEQLEHHLKQTETRFYIDYVVLSNEQGNNTYLYAAMTAEDIHRLHASVVTAQYSQNGRPIIFHLFPSREAQQLQLQKRVKKICLVSTAVMVILGLAIYGYGWLKEDNTAKQPQIKSTPIAPPALLPSHSQMHNLPTLSHTKEENNNKIINLNLNQAPLPEAIQSLAKLLHKSVIISPTITGETTLSFEQANTNQAFSSLLAANNLIEKQIGGVSYIVSQSDMIKHEEEAPLIFQVWRLHYANTEDMAHLLQNDRGALLSKRGFIGIDKRTNTLSINDTSTHLLIINQMIKALDVPVKQIAIAAKLISIDSAYESTLGLQFLPTNASTVANTPAYGQYSVAIATIANASKLDIELAALETNGHAQLISSPRLFTANQETASIESGEEVPYQEVSQSGGTAVAFKKAVLSLKVTPQLLPDAQVLLQLQINQDRPNTTTVLGMPTIITRQITTSVLVKNAQTIVLGGIYETNREQTIERVPFIGRIPVLGKLFTHESNQETKRELLIFVTPYVGG